MDKKETINVFLIGALFVLCYHYFGSLWFLMAAHMMWNYMQDFVFGLPDSGRPAAVSFLNTTVLGSKHPRLPAHHSDRAKNGTDELTGKMGRRKVS